MTKPMTKVIDGEGNETLREMTNAEFAQYEADQAEMAARVAEREAKEAAKQSALAKLGLTAEEVAALFS